MTLQDFLTTKGIRVADLARDLSVERSTISRVASGQRWPSALIMVKIHHLSDGAFTVADWCETCRPLLESQGILPLETSGV